MRDALRGLTVRGRAFLAAGVTAVACAVVLGQPGLTRIGVLLLVLPLLAAVVVGHGRYRLTLSREVLPPVVTAGQTARVRITLGNEGPLPAAPMLLEETLPFALGSRPRFVVRLLGRRRELEYQVRPEQRGRFELGPMTVRVCDPFGLVRLGRAFSSTAPLIVTPRTVPLEPISLTTNRSGSGENRPRSFVGGSAEDVTVREYRHGDDLRRVHWRSSARVGELMVRREEQHWQARATVLLDNRHAAHRGSGSAASFEAAVNAAASIAVHLTERGYAVRLVTTSGQDLAGWQQRDSVDSGGVAALLEGLALVTTVPAAAIDLDWLDATSAGGLIVGVFGGLDGTEVSALRRIRHQSPASLAVLLDVAGWGSRGAGQIDAVDGATLVAQHGWHATTLGVADRLEVVWRRLAVTGAARRTRVH